MGLRKVFARVCRFGENRKNLKRDEPYRRRRGSFSFGCVQNGGWFVFKSTTVRGFTKLLHCCYHEPTGPFSARPCFIESRPTPSAIQVFFRCCVLFSLALLQVWAKEKKKKKKRVEKRKGKKRKNNKTVKEKERGEKKIKAKEKKV